MIKLNLRKNLQSPGSARPVKTSFSSFNEATASPQEDKTAFSSPESKPEESQFLRKLSIKIPYFVAILLLGFSSFAAAQGEIDASLQKKYASNCEFVKSDFKTYIRPNDLKTRLDEVRIYEKIISDQNLIYKRLNANNQPRAGLKNSITNQVNNLSDFKIKFEAYDEVLRKILAVNCSSGSDQLLSLVTDARQQRQQASELLARQNQITSEGITVIDALASQISAKGED
jgi:hypothetical protein